MSARCGRSLLREMTDRETEGTRSAGGMRDRDGTGTGNGARYGSGGRINEEPAYKPVYPRSRSRSVTAFTMVSRACFGSEIETVGAGTIPCSQ